MKIYFLLVLMGVFVGLSYMPIRSEAKKLVSRSPLRYQRDA